MPGMQKSERILETCTDFSNRFFNIGANRRKQGKDLYVQQYVDANGTLEGDRYKRTAVSVGGNQDIIER